jgi:hypothetical protein
MVKRHLKVLGYKYRKLSKNIATGTYKERDTQFNLIFQLVAIMSLDSPIISIDCKKKERIGNLYREGKCYAQDNVEVFDHDYSYLGEGKVIPHGIYDLQKNEGYISIGNSHETADFVADNLLWWWENFGIHHYPTATVILILCDAGGANNYRHHCFKQKMIELAKTIGKDIIICHYPPYASKWNPIEHRLFAPAHRAIQGSVFTDYQLVQTLFEKTTTTTGLKVFVRVVDKHYPIGIKTSKEDVDYTKIQCHNLSPRLIYFIAA